MKQDQLSELAHQSYIIIIIRGATIFNAELLSNYIEIKKPVQHLIIKDVKK